MRRLPGSWTSRCVIATCLLVVAHLLPGLTGDLRQVAADVTGACGNPPSPTIFHPTWSAVVKKEVESRRQERPGVPTAVAIPSEPSEGPGPGLLGAGHAAGQPHPVQPAQRREHAELEPPDDELAELR